PAKVSNADHNHRYSTSRVSQNFAGLVLRICAAVLLTDGLLRHPNTRSGVALLRFRQVVIFSRSLSPRGDVMHFARATPPDLLMQACRSVYCLLVLLETTQFANSSPPERDFLHFSITASVGTDGRSPGRRMRLLLTVILSAANIDVTVARP